MTEAARHAQSREHEVKAKQYMGHRPCSFEVYIHPISGRTRWHVRHVNDC